MTEALDPLHWAIEVEMFDNLRTMSQGTFNIEMYSVNEIVPGSESMEAVANNVIQMTRTFAAQRAGKHPAFEVLGSWPCGPNQPQFQAWYSAGDGMKYLDSLYAQHGIKPFVCIFGWGEMLAFSKFPINTLDDMAGKSFRLGPGMGQEIAKRLGINPMWCSGEEIYTSFDRGVFDICKWGGPSMTWSMNLHEIGKYILWPGYPMPGEVLVYETSPDAWNALPDHHKAMLDMTMKSLAAEAFKIGADNAKYFQKYIDYGCVMTRLPDEDIAKIQKVAAEVMDELCDTDPLVKEIVENQKGFLASFAEYQYYNSLPYRP